MIKEFEGRTEQEAVEKAALELNLSASEFEVEVIDEGRSGLFFKKPVKIRVTVEDEPKSFADALEDEFSTLNGESEDDTPNVSEEIEQQTIEFLTHLISLMGYEAEVTTTNIKGSKLSLSIESEDSSIIIGRKGKNLDALQVIVNAFANQKDDKVKVVLDSENYRVRHEEQIVRLAYRAAHQVKKTGRSQLLDPMNPFERRLVHTALNDVTGIETKSEGTGLIKQVRVISKKRRYN